MNQVNTESKFHVGEYVTLTGIVYEDGTLPKSGNHIFIQTSAGDKARRIRPEVVRPASDAEIEAFQAEAIEGINPEAIIAREAEENAAKGKFFEGEDEDEPEED